MKGLTGRGSSSSASPSVNVFFDLFAKSGLCSLFCRVVFVGRRLRSSAGEIIRRLRIIGADEYKVVASSIAPTFSRKSARYSVNPY